MAPQFRQIGRVQMRRQRRFCSPHVSGSGVIVEIKVGINPNFPLPMRHDSLGFDQSPAALNGVLHGGLVTRKGGIRRYYVYILKRLGIP